MSSTITTSAYDNNTKTWTVTKDGQTYTVTDTNGNGFWDSKDTIKSNDGSTLSAEDLYEAKYQANDDDGVTPEEMAKYDEFKRLQEARDKAKAEKEEADFLKQYSNVGKSNKKKKSFFEKAMPWLNIGMQALYSIGMIKSLFGTNCGSSWQYGCCNDTKVFNFAMMSNMMLGSTAMMSMNPLMTSSLSMPSVDLTSLMTSGGVGSTNALTSAENKLNAFLKAETAAETKKENQDETEYTTTKSAVNKLAELVANSDKAAHLPDSNKRAIQQLSSFAKTEFTEEDKKQIDKLTKYSFIPFGIIGNQLSEQTAEEMNTLIRNVVSLNFTEYTNAKDITDSLKALKVALNATNPSKDDIIAKADALKIAYNARKKI